ncbi:MAG: preprotein translocase subunit SecG [Desulfobacterota bacterium]|nr:preprotein translocase subunit SecG [Thermodesulfobacteriota bacterium]
MTILLIIIHIIVCIALILIVLLQTGRGAEMGAAFGGSSQTLFGGAGPAPFLSRITTIAAVVFLATSLLLAYISVRPGSTVVRDVPVAPQPEQPQDTAPPTE